MISKTMGLTLLAASFVLPLAVPAHATSTSTKPLPQIGSSEQKDVLERERLRRIQVKQNRNNGLFEPIFAPLYQGYNSPGQKMKRAFE